MRQVLLIVALAVLPVSALDLTAAGQLPAGTEITELRAPGARHFSNGNGSIRAVFDITDEEEPTATVTGSIEMMNLFGFMEMPAPSEDFWLMSLMIPYISLGAHSRAFAEWDITSIPDSASIRNVETHIYSQQEFDPPARQGVTINQLTCRPLTHGTSPNVEANLAIYEDCGRGPSYASVPTPPPDTWNEYRLNENACLNLQSQLTEGWFAIGLDARDQKGGNWTLLLAGIELADHHPKLIVDYDFVGIKEEPNQYPLVGNPFISIGPNPLSGGMAVLRYNLPQAGPAQVQVYDATGRNVFSRPLTIAHREASSPLDLHGLSNGVYLVRFVAEGYTSTQKLVVQQ